MLKSSNNQDLKRKNPPRSVLENLLIICGIKHNNFSYVDSVEKSVFKSKNFVEKFGEF